MKNKLVLVWISLFTFVSFGCMATGAAMLPDTQPTNKTPTTAPTSALDVRTVTAESLNVREMAGGDVVGGIYYGDTVTVYEVSTDVNGVEWCRHAGGWSACRYLEAK